MAVKILSALCEDVAASNSKKEACNWIESRIGILNFSWGQVGDWSSGLIISVLDLHFRYTNHAPSFC